MKKILSIDTSSNKEIIVGLKINGQSYLERQEATNRKAQAVLPIVDHVLTEHDTKYTDLTGIEVVVGPGSYTGLRVGVAIANTLGKVLGIPINGKPVGEIVEPVYE